jgi:hypothetical protein
MLKNIDNMVQNKKSLLEIPEFLKRIMNDDTKKSKKSITVFKEEPLEEIKEETKKEKPKKPKVDIQARMQSQAQDYIIDIRDINYATFDNELHELSIQSVYEYCKEEDIPMAYCSRLIDDVEGFKKEYEWILKIRSIPRSKQTDEEKDLGEGYDLYSNKEMKQMADIQDKAIEQIYRWSKIKQGERKARKPRAISVERMIKKLQYKEEDNRFKIQSIDPILIPRCQMLWVFNTKTRKLSQYNAMGPNGITIKGTTLKNYNGKNSVSKTVRKPETILPKLLTTDGKIAMRNIWESIKTTETKNNGRINKDIILLKVLK